METTANQIKKMWKLAVALPADGVARPLPGIGLLAKRCPATASRIEQVLVQDGDKCLRRRLVNGKWAKPEELPATAWNR